MLKLFKFIAILLLVLTFPAEAQMGKTAVQSQILLNWPDNNSNAITASKLRIPNQIIVNSYLDLNGATSFQCPANQAMIGFSTLSTPSCSLVSGLLTTTGTGAFVLANSPILVTPNLGTPSVVVLTNGTGLPVATGITGLGTGVSTALATSVGTAGSVVINGGALGTPSSGVGTNLTALNASNLASGTVPAARGGAGTITGALKGNGAGVVSQAATTDLSDVTAAGSWTPVDGSGAGLTFTGVQASYTKIGNMVFAYAFLTYPTTASGLGTVINGLPVTVPNVNYARGPCNVYSNSGGAIGMLLTANTTGGFLTNNTSGQLTNANMSGAVVILTCTYPAS